MCSIIYLINIAFQIINIHSIYTYITIIYTLYFVTGHLFHIFKVDYVLVDPSIQVPLQNPR